MKNTFLTTLMLLFALSGFGQNFSKISFKEAQVKAEKERKIILVDVGSSGMNNPIKGEIEKKVAATAGVEALMNKSIIAVRIDMMTPEGKEFAPRLMMNMYPTYAFLMPNGDLLGVVSPFLLDKNPALFLEKAEAFLKDAEVKWSNSRKIEFASLGFEEALKLAKKENKLLFVDAVTDNCQPCMMMVKNVFTLDRVADFYNHNFINLTMNWGVEHKDLAERYGTFAYPTFLFIDGDGNLVLSEAGYRDGDKFMDLGKKALEARGIQFFEGTWKEVLEKAQLEKKPIFVDCYTVWCGPCKTLAANVFTDPKVGSYFNSNFINVKVDMEKGEGIDLKNKYQVGAYPTLLYLDSEGNEINRIVGSMPADKFLAESKKGMSESGLISLKKRYAAGERGEEFVFEYLKALESAYMQPEANKVATAHLQSIAPERLKEKQNWALFVRYASDADSDYFKYLHANRAPFYELFGKEAVDNKIFEIWTIKSQSFTSGEAPNATIDVNGYKAFLKRLKKDKALQASLITENANLFNAQVSGDWKSFYTIATSKIKRAGGIEKMDQHQLYIWGTQLDKLCDNNDIRSESAVWFKTMLPVIVEREKVKKEQANMKGGMVMAMSMINYEKEFERLSNALSNPIKK